MLYRGSKVFFFIETNELGDSLWIIFHISPYNICCGHLTEAILMSTHNICFYGELSKSTVMLLSFQTDRSSQCRSRSDCSWRSSMIKVYTVFRSSMISVYTVFRNSMIRVYTVFRCSMIRVYTVFRSSMIRVYTVFRSSMIRVYTVFRSSMIRVYTVFRSSMIRVYTVFRSSMIRVYTVLNPFISKLWPTMTFCTPEYHNFSMPKLYSPIRNSQNSLLGFVDSSGFFRLLILFLKLDQTGSIAGWTGWKNVLLPWSWDNLSVETACTTFLQKTTHTVKNN